MQLRGVRISRYITTIGLLLTIALAACSGSGASGGISDATTPGASGTRTGGGASASPVVLPPTVTPTTSIAIASPTSGEQGAGEFCTNPPNINGKDVPLPPSIPAYPNAQMPVHKMSVDPGTQGDMFFVLCTGDSVSTVLNFYLEQLPAKGWQNLVHSTILEVDQIQASKGTGTMTISIQPDVASPHTTEIFIQSSGVL